jgi:hypothetical protein
VAGGWRKLHKVERRITRVMESMRMRWTRHVARMGEKRNAYNIVVRKPEGNRPLESPRRR